MLLIVFVFMHLGAAEALSSSGTIEILDGIVPVNDQQLPFGEVIIGLPRESWTFIRNIDFAEDLVVEDVVIKKTVEDFEDGDLAEYKILGGSHILSGTAAWEGSYGLESNNAGWAYRNDQAAQVSQGQILSCWVYLRADGRAYFGFGANSLGTYSLVLSVNTSALILQRNVNYDQFDTLASVSYGWTLNKWYRVEVRWEVGGTMTGRVFDSDGSTLLVTVAGFDNTFTSGGIAFRSFGWSVLISNYFDMSELSISALQSQSSQVSSLPSESGSIVAIDSGQVTGWDEENQAPIYEKSEIVWADYTNPTIEEQGASAAGGPYGGFYLDGLASLPITIGPWNLYGFKVLCDPSTASAYAGKLLIESSDGNTPEVPVFLSGTGVLDDLEIEPSAGATFSGHPGGPFMPSQAVYTLTNNDSTEAIIWSAAADDPCLVLVEPGSGTLGPQTSVDIIIEPTALVRALGEGTYQNELLITNNNSTLVQSRSVTLEVYTAPKVWVEPGAYDLSIPEGGLQQSLLTISNSGDGDLHFNVESREVVNNQPESQTSVFNLSAPAGHDFTVVPSGVARVEGELLVRFSPKGEGLWPQGADKEKILAAAGGGQIKREFNILPGLCVVELPAGMSLEEGVVKYNNADGIVYAEPNYKVSLAGGCQNFPNDGFFANLWGMHNTGQSGGVVDADIDAPEAWCKRTAGSDMVVAIIDSGVDYEHEDLAGNMWRNSGEIAGNGIDDDGNGFVDDVYGFDFINYDGDPMDDHEHGTHVAGTVGAVGNNGIGVTGVCWDVQLMALKFLDSYGDGSDAGAIAAIEYAVQMGAKVLNNSWGGGSYNQSLKDAILAAEQADVLFVAAAGNDYGLNNDVIPFYPASYDCDNIITVLSTDDEDELSVFSNYGPQSVDLGAPGSSILSCAPYNQYQYLSGTSMAAPHVSGAAGLVWTANPYLGCQEVKNILLQSVDPVPGLSGLCVSQGRLNLSKALEGTQASWIEFAAEGAIVVPGDACDVGVLFNTEGLPPGIYEAEIVVTTNDVYTPEVVIPVSLTVTADPMIVIPATDAVFSGPAKGPFSPGSKNYILSNQGQETLVWEASISDPCDPCDWLIVEPGDGMLNPLGFTSITVRVDEQVSCYLKPGEYHKKLIFTNTTSGVTRTRRVTLSVTVPDYFTEQFDDNDNDVSQQTLTFVPSLSCDKYNVCREEVTAFPVDPAGGTSIALRDDDYFPVGLSGKTISYYGKNYGTFYIGSNGYVTFVSGDVRYTESLADHFDLPRISGLFNDLTPGAGGEVSWKQLDNSVAVTFENVPEYNQVNSNSFQIEMFYNGRIRITWLEIEAQEGIMGLSGGDGVPAGFLESDLSAYEICPLRGDFDKSGGVNLEDFAVLAGYWLVDCNVNNAWCEGADIIGDSTVGLMDLLEFSGVWLAESQP